MVSRRRRETRRSSSEVDARTSPDSSPLLTVYYDADCGLCNGQARLLERLDWQRRLRLVALQQTALDVADAPPVEQLLTSMHVRDENGAWASGAAASVQIARRIPLLRPVAVAARLPFVVRLLERGYAPLARNRSRLSSLMGMRACRVGRPR